MRSSSDGAHGGPDVQGYACSAEHGGHEILHPLLLT